MGRDFDKSELYSNSQLLLQIEEHQKKIDEFQKKIDEHRGRITSIRKTLVFREEIELCLLEKLVPLVNNQAFNIFVFIFKYGSVDRKKLMMFFPTTTIYRYIPKLEAIGVLVYKDRKYWVKG